MTNFQVVCLEYVLVLYPLMLIFLTWLCIELYTCTRLQASGLFLEALLCQSEEELECQ